MKHTLILFSAAAAMSAYVVPIERPDAFAGSAVGCASPAPLVTVSFLDAPTPLPGGGTVFVMSSSGFSGFTISGLPGEDPPLTLTRGVTYIFSNTVSASHPMQIRFSPQGMNLGPVQGVTGGGSATVTFTPDFSLPSSLVYQCQIHSTMVGIITLVDPPLLVAPKAFLEGPYNASTGLMADALRTLPDFPLTEPYTALGYVHVGSGGATVGPMVLSISGNGAVVDWVVVELRDATTPAVVLATRSALLQRDGDVVGTDGSSPLQFNVAAGNYLLALRHRNHLGIMTLNAVALSGTIAAVDFTTATTATFGTGAQKSITGTFPAQALWAGDVTFNNQLKYAGSNNDRDPILTAIGGTIPTNTLSGQYRKEDINMNGQVKYAGSANDRDILLQNIGGTVPTAVRNAQVP